jgi:pilus assembly protein TadC
MQLTFLEKSVLALAVILGVNQLTLFIFTGGILTLPFWLLSILLGGLFQHDMSWIIPLSHSIIGGYAIIASVYIYYDRKNNEVKKLSFFSSLLARLLYSRRKYYIHKDDFDKYKARPIHKV